MKRPPPPPPADAGDAYEPPDDTGMAPDPRIAECLARMSMRLGLNLVAEYFAGLRGQPVEPPPSLALSRVPQPGDLELTPVRHVSPND